MKLLILNHKEKLYEGEVKDAVLPGKDGEFSVWDFHQPFLYRLQKGYILFTVVGDNKKRIKRRFFIKDGIAKMTANTLAILSEL